MCLYLDSLSGYKITTDITRQVFYYAVFTFVSININILTIIDTLHTVDINAHNSFIHTHQIHTTHHNRNKGEKQEIWI